MNKDLHSAQLCRFLFVFVLFLLCFIPSLFAQVSTGGLPYGLSPAFQSKSKLATSTTSVPALDMKRIQREDKGPIGAARFAAPATVDIQPQSHGDWIDLENGDRLWRLELKAADAFGLFLTFDEFYLPAGSYLYCYSPDGRQVKGGYTSANNPTSGQFLIGMIEGESAILEYYEPKAQKGLARLHVNRIYQAYTKTNIESDYPYQAKGTQGFGDAAACNVNINCPEAADWQDHKRGVMRILRIFEEGAGWCTGTLINNTRQDATPYVLTAFHCIAGFTPILNLWRFDFGIEAEGCDNPPEEPPFYSILGCDQMAGREESDVLLLRLFRDVPNFINPYFAGWDRTPISVGAGSVGIHHPWGDVKKFSKDNDAGSIFSNSIPWNNNVTTPPNHHLFVSFDIGTYENGSSGSPLYNSNGLVVGQLHGGVSNCLVARAYYGRLAISWDAGPTRAERLMEWLDPDGTGAMTLAPLDPPPSFLVNGIVQTSKNQPISGAMVIGTVNGMVDTFTTDASGLYWLEVPQGGDIDVQVRKIGNIANGLSAFDIVLVRRHLLDVAPFVDPYLAMAGDVNNSGDISAIDIVNINRALLLAIDEFPNGDSWRFDNDGRASAANVAQDVRIDFTGVKVGDLNFSANPLD